MSLRFQFSLKWLFWSMLVAAAFFVAGRRWAERQWLRERTRLKEEVEEMTVRARSAEYFNKQLERQEQQEVRIQEL